MKLRTSWKLLTATILIVGMANCSQLNEDKHSKDKHVKDKDIKDALLLLGIAIQSFWKIEGTWNYFNGTKDYPGSLFIDNGTVVQGQYTITQTRVTREIKDTGFGASKLIGDIIEIDRSKKAVYVQFTQDSSFSKGKFSWYRWTSKDDYVYICPDLSGVNNQNTLEQAKADNLDSFSDPNNINSGCGLNSGFDPAPWSRLELKKI
ncbi:LIC13354 family exoprotein [Leptospira santarosai]|uniref:LIC13354 family exoprotein n=1 Tax=Leptospira santarosai TaxID=28183 RepID=UPI0002BF95F9|nr:hypothetical protein [Leptospira santarosai]EMO71833.1 hypothetical protein LEP1GSC130_0818 [Leptospira santarosai str. 200403458]EMO99105.1 hypothetical protein LEP1GSC120_1729 [Leptospira santarosai str. 200702252]EMP80905.1 hypothetical protein LEP1GSC162_2189 [Leptospira santarosai str. CBC1531]MDI7156014.1 hypothetical protein [Leptospira santarosai]